MAAPTSSELTGLLRPTCGPPRGRREHVLGTRDERIEGELELNVDDRVSLGLQFVEQGVRGGHSGDAPTASLLRGGVEVFDHRGAPAVRGQGEVDRQCVVGLNPASSTIVLTTLSRLSTEAWVASGLSSPERIKTSSQSTGFS